MQAQLTQAGMTLATVCSHSLSMPTVCCFRLHVFTKNVHPFLCDSPLHNELKEKALSYTKSSVDIEKAGSMVNDYLRDRALGKIGSDFWTAYKNKTSKSSGQADSPCLSPEDSEDHTSNDTECHTPCSDEEHNSDEDTTNQATFDEDAAREKQALSLTSFLPQREMAATRRSATLSPYINTIKKMKVLLLGIAANEVFSERHRIFESGSKEEKRCLNSQSGLGPLDSEEAQDEVFGLLLSWYQSCFPDSRHDPVSYVANVLLPEALIRSIQKVKNCSYRKAEQIFLK